MMEKILTKENTIKIGKEPMVVLPLKKWEEIKQTIEDFEDTIRFNKAYWESRGEKTIGLKELKKKYSLK